VNGYLTDRDPGDEGRSTLPTIPTRPGWLRAELWEEVETVLWIAGYEADGALALLEAIRADAVRAAMASDEATASGGRAA
jgi:hypothetical protein